MHWWTVGIKQHLQRYGRAAELLPLCPASKDGRTPGQLKVVAGGQPRSLPACNDFNIKRRPHEALMHKHK